MNPYGGFLRDPTDPPDAHAPAPTRGRPAREAGGGGRRARLRRDLRALSPGALPLLPRDPGRRARRAGRSAGHDGERAARRCRASRRGSSSGPGSTGWRATSRSRSASPAPPVAEADESRTCRATRGGRRVRVARTAAHARRGSRTLPERQRSALVMRELSGLCHEQIAAALGISPGAARQVVYEARLRCLSSRRDARWNVSACAWRSRSGDGRGPARPQAARAPARLPGLPGLPRRDRAAAADLELVAPPLAAVAASGVLATVLGGGARRPAARSAALPPAGLRGGRDRQGACRGRRKRRDRHRRGHRRAASTFRAWGIPAGPRPPRASGTPAVDDPRPRVRRRAGEWPERRPAPSARHEGPKSAGKWRAQRSAGTARHGANQRPGAQERQAQPARPPAVRPRPRRPERSARDPARRRQSRPIAPAVTNVVPTTGSARSRRRRAAGRKRTRAALGGARENPRSRA